MNYKLMSRVRGVCVHTYGFYDCAKKSFNCGKVLKLKYIYIIEKVVEYDAMWEITSARASNFILFRS